MQGCGKPWKEDSEYGMDRQVDTQDKAKDKNMKIRMRKLQGLGTEQEVFPCTVQTFGLQIFSYIFSIIIFLQKENIINS